MQPPFSEPTHAQLLALIQSQAEHIQALENALASQQRKIDALLDASDTYRVLLDESSDPIFSFYPDGTYRYVNQAFASGVGRDLDEIIGRRIWDVFEKAEADKRFATVKWVFENAEMRVIEVRVPRPDGDRYYITTVKPILNEHGHVRSVICISKEITERKRMEEELRRLSMYDLLTGLYNRNFFETELVRLQESRLFPVTIVMVDLNHLKIVNDTQGHAAGDELIRRAARVLKENFRAEDIIARYGGDEFVVLLPETSEQVAGEIIRRLHAHVQSIGDPLFSLAVGAVTGEKGSLLTDLLRKADDRMYLQKAATRPRKD
jgi:diguanylate cyclase (GGDEF)-like protein/PAS domain S-box-containing protein